MAKPMLSIGMIFKNEVRCLERCMKSLQPLRDAIPCELVMADTGADDGSREIAEKYADILIDFPWINDFSAARNAVMDRCSGEWYLTVDADEWLDEDFTQLTQFLKSKDQKQFSFCGVIQRNYTTHDIQGGYGDFLAVRMARLSPEVRYFGAIHESWSVGSANAFAMTKVVLHHDGYVGLSGEAGRAKRKRNMSLLREELEKDPKNLKTLLQCIESSGGDPDHEEYIRRAEEGVNQKLPQWELFGPPIFRVAVMRAASQGLEEFESKLENAQNSFPNSLCVRIDVAYVAFTTYLQREDYDKAIPFGEIYLQAITEYRSGQFDASGILFSSLGSVSPNMEEYVRLMMSNAYFQVKDYHKSQETIQTVDIERMNVDSIKKYVGILCNLQAQSEYDVSHILFHFWEKLDLSNDKSEKAAERIGGLIAAASLVFPMEYRKAEQEHGYRHAYTLFLPLAGVFEMGIAARILEASLPAEMEEALAGVKDWSVFPIHALRYALSCGIRFPLPDKPLHMEEMDHLANRLSQEGDSFLPVAMKILESNITLTLQGLCWARCVAVSALRVNDWSAKQIPEGKMMLLSLDDPEQSVPDVVGRGMAIARAFAKVEGKYLPLCYTEEVLNPDGLFLLPPMHRFGWYCVQAFQALDRGDQVGYVRLLREGLAVCESAKDIVEFLMEHIPETQPQTPSAELSALAEQIQTMLSRFSPDDPMVAALKQSEAYQKVAYLIDGVEPPVRGGLLQ